MLENEVTYLCHQQTSRLKTSWLNKAYHMFSNLLMTPVGSHKKNLSHSWSIEPSRSRSFKARIFIFKQRSDSFF